MRRDADTLNNQCDRSFLDICAGNRQGHTFGIGIYANDDEMTGSTATGNKRSFNYELRYIVREKSFRKNFVHIFSLSGKAAVYLEMLCFFTYDRGKEVVGKAGSAEAEPLVVEPLFAEDLFHEGEVLNSLVGSGNTSGSRG